MVDQSYYDNLSKVLWDSFWRGIWLAFEPIMPYLLGLVLSAIVFGILYRIVNAFTGIPVNKIKEAHNLIEALKAIFGK